MFIKNFNQILDQRLSRRRLLQTSTLASASFFLNGCNLGFKTTTPKASSHFPAFAPVAANTFDNVTVPAEYSAEVLISWGDPILRNAPAFDPKGSTKAHDQQKQFGDNNDGMSFFNLDSHRALLAVNNEYTNYRYLFAHQGIKLSAEDVKTAQAAVGVSIIEIQRKNNDWVVNPSSPYNRRIDANQPMKASGPAAGHPLMRTQADPEGKHILGTFANCANGKTPWNTYLTCEENFNGFFGSTSPLSPSPRQKRYGLKGSNNKAQWHQHDNRFDLSQNPNEANRFGWVVEIDPLDPSSTPIKRTALGRFKHENAAFALSADQRAVVYMGDDSKGEHLYKFVSSQRFQEGNDTHNRQLLDKGTLYTAQFAWKNDDSLSGTGRWLPLTLGSPGLDDGRFNSQAEIMIFAREAASRVGATTLDRPEWVAVNPNNQDVYCTLTNNSHRGLKAGQPVGGPNPRANNRFGQIIRWRPDHQDHASETFSWDLFALAGNPATETDPLYQGSNNINADNMFNSPDGLGFDPSGGLWILTDGNDSNEGRFAGMGNNQLLAASANSGEIKRFMVGPKGCEITGLSFSPDQRTMFVGIQHPGGGDETSHFPAGGNSKPRSSVMKIRRKDDGVIGY